MQGQDLRLLQLHLQHVPEVRQRPRPNTTCLSHAIDAQRVLGWLVHKLQETFLGPRRDELVQEIKAELTAAAKANSGDVERLTKRAGGP